MNNYFGINLEFDQFKVHSIINKHIENRQKGYVCVVDGNVVANAHKNNNYKAILNNSLVNICDGKSIAQIASIIHKKKLKTYTGPDIFSSFVRKKYKQLFLGNTEEVLNKLKEKFAKEGIDIEKMNFLPLPFKEADEFDYTTISNTINQFSPDIIWVSLGAPKQEIFISKLYPLINNGILFAIGAALNLYIDDKKFKRAPKFIRNLGMEWLYRCFKEPKRIGKKAFNYFTILPNLIIQEIKIKEIKK